MPTLEEYNAKIVKAHRDGNLEVAKRLASMRDRDAQQPQVESQPHSLARLGQAATGAVNMVTQPLPTRSPMEGEYWKQNVPESFARLPAALATGAGQMAYGAAKEFTDPIANAFSGEKSLGDAAVDMFWAPKRAGNQIVEGLKEFTAAPFGLSEQRTAKEAWSDPAASLLAVAPVAKLPGILRSPRTKTLAERVKKGMDKSATISRTGLNTEGQIQKAYKDATGAVESIIKRKDELVYSDFAGELSKGKLPKNLTEFSQSISQLKKTVFKAYNDMTKKAGGAGAKVSQAPVIAELDSIVRNKTYQQHAPETVRYAQKKLWQLEENPTITAEGAETAIALYNDRLKAFGKNPHPDGVSGAAVDNVIRSHLRKSLDDTITAAEGEGYAALKKEYGNLSSIEEAVNKRRMRDDQASGVDTMNFYDVISAHDFIAGTLTANPAHIAKGGAIAALSKSLKMRRDPNRAVAKMFKDSEKIIGRGDQPTSLAERFSKGYVPAGMSLGARLSGRGD